MYRRANYLLYVLAVATPGLLLLSACTNDLKKIQEISARQAKGGADSTLGVNAIYSDSAHVKAQITSPLMLEYTADGKDIKESYRLMPKGVKIIYFDKNHKELLNIIADTAYAYDLRKQIVMHKNVVLTSAKGDVFKSEELVWDQAKHKIYSNKAVDFKMANGNVGHGTALETNESFYPLTMKNGTGFVYIDSSFGQ